MLEDANLKLGSVLSKLLGRGGIGDARDDRPEEFERVGQRRRRSTESRAGQSQVSESDGLLRTA
jgi:hypothetical protein